MNRIVKFHRQRFLNLPGHQTTAFIHATLTHKNENTWDRWEAEYAIANCDRKIDFDIQLTSAEEVENALYKLDQIIEVTKDFRKAVASLGKKLERERRKEEDEAVASG